MAVFREKIAAVNYPRGFFSIFIIIIPTTVKVSGEMTRDTTESAHRFIFMASFGSNWNRGSAGQQASRRPAR